MKKLYERLLMVCGIIGYIRVFEGQPERLVPGQWTPRFDKHGRIYMLIAPSDK